MLIDSTHKRWFQVTVLLAVAAVGVYLLFRRLSPGELTGGSTVGLWYGIIGSALMVYAGLLSAHRKVPKWWWIGSRKTWLRGHIWLGLLSAVFLVCHSGFRWGGPLEFWLWVVTIGTLVTGVLGLLLQHVLPRLLTVRVPAEAPFEQIPHLCLVLRRKADELVDKVCGPNPEGSLGDDLNTRAAIQIAEDGKAQLRSFYEHDVRPLLAPRVPRKAALLDPLQAESRFAKLKRLAGMAEVREQLDTLAGMCEERRQMAEQEKIHFWLHSWLLVHVPLAAAVLVLGAAHAITAVYF